MLRAILASAILASAILATGCTVDPVEYEVTTRLSAGNDTKLVFDGLLYSMHTETYVVEDYDELRDVAVSVTVRRANVDNYVVLPFAASECGSASWRHSGELRRIEVKYVIYASSASFEAYTESVTCIDSNGEMHFVN